MKKLNYLLASLIVLLLIFMFFTKYEIVDRDKQSQLKMDAEYGHGVRDYINLEIDNYVP